MRSICARRRRRQPLDQECDERDRARGRQPVEGDAEDRAPTHRIETTSLGTGEPMVRARGKPCFPPRARSFPLPRGNSSLASRPSCRPSAATGCSPADRLTIKPVPGTTTFTFPSSERSMVAASQCASSHPSRRCEAASAPPRRVRRGISLPLPIGDKQRRGLHCPAAVGPLAQLVEQGTLNPKVEVRILHGPSRNPCSQGPYRVGERVPGCGEPAGKPECRSHGKGAFHLGVELRSPRPVTVDVGCDLES